MSKLLSSLKPLDLKVLFCGTEIAIFICCKTFASLKQLKCTNNAQFVFELPIFVLLCKRENVYLG